MNRWLSLILIGLIFSSCATQRGSVHKKDSNHMMSSWYGEPFHGRPTASGEKFDMYQMTAAHKKLPFGTMLHLTNPQNGRSVTVKVNDRGPFVSGRDLDVSYAAAKELDIIRDGVALLNVDYLTRDESYRKAVVVAPAAEQGPVTIQVGAFANPGFAEQLKQGLDQNYSEVYIAETIVNGEQFYRVRVGRFSDKITAEPLAQQLANEGYPTLITQN